jgi:hypothetical protein
MSCVPTLQRESIRLYLLPGLEENDVRDDCIEAAVICPAAEQPAASASFSGPSGTPNGVAGDNVVTAHAASDGGAAWDDMTDDDTAAAQGGAAESSSNSQSGG